MLVDTFKYSLKDFKNEEEISQFFEENLNLIFPRLTHIKTSWEIYDVGSESGESKIDALAFWGEKKDKEGRIVIIEYKNDDPKDPINQITDYFDLMKDNKGNIGRLEKIFSKYLIQKRGLGVGWDFDNQKQEREFWKKSILICIAPPSCFTKGKRKTKAEEKEVILVEVKKYGNKETDFILISLVKEKWKELLGMEESSIIIHLSKKGKKTVKSKVVKERQKEENDTTQGEKGSDIELFLRESKADEWAKEKIKEIDKNIQLFDNSIDGKATQKVKNKHRYFVYYKDKRRLLCVYPQSKKKEFTIYLKDNKTTTELDKNNSGDSYAKGFERIFVIKNKEDYKKFSGKIKSYLKSILKELDT